MDVSANKGDPDGAYVVGVDFGTLSARASEVVQTARARAVTEYDKLARRGKQALNGEATHGRGALNGKSSRAREAKD